MVDQVKDARARFPHLSQVSFHDDSFMAIPYGQLEEFAELWHDELKLPFAVYGVIPNYVRQDKFELLSWAGMNRIRMGIQSGSKDMLDFYRRHAGRSRRAGEVIARSPPGPHPRGVRLIMDNPIETRTTSVTLQLCTDDRPYTLFITRVSSRTRARGAMRSAASTSTSHESTSRYHRVPRLCSNSSRSGARPPGPWKRLMPRAASNTQNSIRGSASSAHSLSLQRVLSHCASWTSR